jgi:choline dehydrogenase-like flavoprotein
MMWEHAKEVCTEALRKAGGEVWGLGEAPNVPCWSLHETGTCRMGNDPKKFVTNRFGQTHDVNNVTVATQASCRSVPTKQRQSLFWRSLCARATF